MANISPAKTPRGRDGRRRACQENTPEDVEIKKRVFARLDAAAPLADCCPGKLDLGLGNVVSQLHVHVIARSRGDAAWPRPVWNAVPPRDYDSRDLEKLLASLRERLTLKPL